MLLLVILETKFVFLLVADSSFFCSFGGFKGQARWPEEPPHFALNPSNFLVCFLEGLRVSLRWPEGAPHLALNPLYLFFSRDNKLFSPNNRTFLLVGLVSPLVSPQPFFATPFDSLSLCLLIFFLSSFLLFLSLVFCSFLLFLFRKHDNIHETRKLEINT